MAHIMRVFVYKSTHNPSVRRNFFFSCYCYAKRDNLELKSYYIKATSTPGKKKIK